jgi:hypothetical protein
VSSTPINLPTSSRASITNRLVAIKRQENVKSSTDTICSELNRVEKTNPTTPTPTPLAQEKAKHFQHENLACDASPRFKKPSLAQDAEDDEEIKNIIMNNLNEKLKLSAANKKLHHRPKHHHYQQQQQQQQQTAQSSYKLKKMPPSSTSSLTSTEVDSTSGSEYDGYQSNEHFPPQHKLGAQAAQPSQRLRHQLRRSIETHHRQLKVNSSSGNTANDCSSADDSVSSLDKKLNEVSLGKHKPKSNCKYCDKSSGDKPKLKGAAAAVVVSSSSSSLSSTKSKLLSAHDYQLLQHSPPVANSAAYYYVYSPVNRHKNGDDRVYAYDNFDCINECIEESEMPMSDGSKYSVKYRKDMIQRKYMQQKYETHQQVAYSKINEHIEELEQEENEEDDEEEEEKCFTSILVEDGFIRMSSPVENSVGTPSSAKDQESCASAFQYRSSLLNNNNNNNENDSSSHIPVEEYHECADSTCDCGHLTNFPNVGSSPISEEFINSNSSSDNEDQEYGDNTHLINYNIKNKSISIKGDPSRIKYTESDGMQTNEDHDFDGIIHHTANNNEIVSLSDEEDLVIEADDPDFEEDEQQHRIVREVVDDECSNQGEYDLQNQMEQEQAVGDEQLNESDECTEENDNNNNTNEDEDTLDDNLGEEEEPEVDYFNDEECLLEKEQAKQSVLSTFQPKQSSLLNRNDQIRQNPKSIQYNQLKSEIEYHQNMKLKHQQQQQTKRAMESTNSEVRPHSIMKNSSLRSENSWIAQKSFTEHSISTMVASSSTHMSNSSMVNSANSDTLNMSPLAGMNTSSSHSANLFQAQQHLTQQQMANLNQKPKVRFNLDINYEKEREWNRVNKIIGDASKSQIEWTQEVEV